MLFEALQDPIAGRLLGNLIKALAVESQPSMTYRIQGVRRCPLLTDGLSTS
jgi:hypothetical protein